MSKTSPNRICPECGRRGYETELMQESDRFKSYACRSKKCATWWTVSILDESLEELKGVVAKALTPITKFLSKIITRFYV